VPIWGNVLVWSVALVAGACAEQKVVCPPGFSPQGVFCYPDKQPAPANDAGFQPETVGFPAVDSGDADNGVDANSQPQDTSSVLLFDASKPDTGPVDAGPPKSPIGASCADDLDCLVGLSCFSWPKGYCTQLNCNNSAGAPCPGSSVCWGETKQTHICIDECDFNSDCRVADDYACKRLTAKFGGLDARLCTPSGKSPAGLLCKKPLDCKGSATCVTDIDGGYCARIGCGPNDPCDADTACVLRNGKPTCLKTCAADADCSVGPKLPRKCVVRTDLQKKTVKVCLDSDKAGAIGDPCGADLDCDSGKCIIVAKGGCKVGDQPCLVDQQCGAAGPCVLDKQKEVGVCGQGCSNKEGCPTGSVCVPGDQFLVGSCQPACKGPQDIDTCKKVPGTACLFGQPIAPPFGNQPATYACGPLTKGAAGSLCSKGADCASNDCNSNLKGTSGYCSADCGGGKPECPYGTWCVSSGLEQCEKLCAVDYDCPPQMTCQKGAGGKKVCQIP
jgi:hypothetical protein